jgi:type II secretory pathway pseudopilin PulG
MFSGRFVYSFGWLGQRRRSRLANRRVASRRSRAVQGRSRGFTLTELVVIILFLAVVATSLVPTILNRRDGGDAEAREQAVNAVREALPYAVADVRADPTVQQLANYVQGGAEATATGVQVSVGQRKWLVPTFTDEGCTRPTLNPTRDRVKCVGGL